MEDLEVILSKEYEKAILDGLIVSRNIFEIVYLRGYNKALNIHSSIIRGGYGV